MEAVGSERKHFVIREAAYHCPRFLHLPSSEDSFKTCAVGDDLNFICCPPSPPLSPLVPLISAVSVEKLNRIFPLKLKIFELLVPTLIL